VIKKLLKYSLIGISILLLIPSLKGQLIISSPSFPTDNQSVVVTFNSSLGSGGLASYTGDIYAHTGVITNLSTSSSNWKYVKTNWGVNTVETKLTQIGPNLYQLSINPNIRDYYAVPAGETILQMAFVFRSGVAVGGSYLEGKTSSGTDIMLDVYQAGLNLNLVKPSSGVLLAAYNDTLFVTASATDADSIVIYHEGSLLAADSGNFIQDTLLLQNYGKRWIKAVAKNSTDLVSDSFYYFLRQAVPVEPLPIGIKEGINYIDSTQVTLCLYSPFKEFAFVLGDFNNWELDSNYYMKRSPDNQYFWLSLKNLIPSKEYIFQYFVDGEIYIGDPYAEKVSDPWNDSYISSSTYPNMLTYPSGKASGIASVLQTQQPEYDWKHTSYNVPPKSELVIYELLIRDFHASHTFQSVIDSLAYLRNLGINAIELMPINEFEGNNSWGYNPNYYFAVDKYYGKPELLKKLIDTCHAVGIAVILDVVYNHSFGTSPYVKLWWDKTNNRPSADNPFFNMVAKHDYNVGFDMNHQSSATVKYISRALQYWTVEYKVDGFRLDLSKGFTQKNTLGNVASWGQYDADRIHTLSRYADSVWLENPNAYVILEHFADNSEETDLSSKGMMLWGNLNGKYAEAAMGYNSSSKSDFSWISYQNRGWANPNLVGYMESHDEERLMYKCQQYGNSIDDYNIKLPSTYMERSSLDAAFFLTIPGPKMIWQFGELGYDISIDFNGRTGEKPIKWDYFQNNDRRNTYYIYKAINELRNTEKACFQTTDFTLEVASALKSIVLRDVSMNLVVLGNFDISKQTYLVNFPHNGIWYDYLSGDSILVAENQYSFELFAGEFHLMIDKWKPTPSLVIPPSPIQKDEPTSGELFELMPVPSGSELYFNINTATEAEISFFDLSGRLLKRYQVEGTGVRKLIINNASDIFGSGIFLVELTSGTQNEVKRVVLL
jgi:glycosidase